MSAQGRTRARCAISEAVALALTVGGRVQGVGFRWWTRSLAAELGLCGWVRNEPDGTVRIEVDGDDASLSRFTSALQSGPPGARVEEVEVREIPPLDASAFTISH